MFATKCNFHSLHYSFTCDASKAITAFCYIYIYTSLHDKRSCDFDAMVGLRWFSSIRFGLICRRKICVFVFEVHSYIKHTPIAIPATELMNLSKQKWRSRLSQCLFHCKVGNIFIFFFQIQSFDQIYDPPTAFYQSHFYL